jgi:hypothetical protein
MDEKQFKKHLKDLAHGHHHPEEHDWAQSGTKSRKSAPKTAKRSKKSAK